MTSDTMANQGIVRWFDKTKGWGFIQRLEIGTPDIFVHRRQIEGGARTLDDGDPVEYEIGQCAKGEAAQHVRIVKSPAVKS